MTSLHTSDPVAASATSALSPDADGVLSSLASELNIGSEYLTVTVYRGPSLKAADYLNQYDAAEFSLGQLQRDYGAGAYFVQLKRDTKIVKQGALRIGPRPASAAAPAPLALAPAPVVKPADDSLLMLMFKQSEQAQQRSHEMLLALLRKPEPAPVLAPAADPLAMIQTVVKLVQPQRTPLSELMDAMVAMKSMGDGGGGSGGAGELSQIMQALPGIVAAFRAGQSIDNHPEVARARQLYSELRSREAIAAAPARLPVSEKSAVGLPSAAVSAAPLVGDDDRRREIIRRAGSMVAVAASTPDTDPCTYAQMVLDIFPSQGIDPAWFIGPTPGHLTALFVAEFPAVAEHAKFIRDVEDDIRRAIVEQGPGETDDDGNPRAGNPATAPKS